MAKLPPRITKLERRKRRIRFVHVFPGRTRRQALAAHRRKHGPVPPKTRVVFIVHTFKSAI